jgi:hypothetical protein
MEKRFAKVESVLKQLQRIETAQTWQKGNRPDRDMRLDGVPVEDEGPWDVEPLEYAKIQRRLVGKWEPFPDESNTGLPTS